MLAPGPGSRHPVRHTSCASAGNTGEDLAISQRNPRGVRTFPCHCNQRPELTIEPFSSAKQVMADGTLRSGSSTSQLRSAHLVLPEVRGFSVQWVDGDEELSFDRQPITLFLFGNEATGLNPGRYSH